MCEANKDIERLLVFRPKDLHESFADLLGRDNPLRSCLFWIERPDSRAARELLEAIPEPVHPTKDIEAGTLLAHTLGTAATQSFLLAEIIAEGCVGGRMTMGCRAGFHAGDAEEVREWLKQQGHELLPASALLDQLALLALDAPDGRPATAVQLRSHTINADSRQTLRPIGDGLFAIDCSNESNESFTLYHASGGFTYFGRHPGPGEHWLDLTLDDIPGGQITRLRFPRASTGDPTAPRSETVVVCRLADLPVELTAKVPGDSPLWSSLFWVAPSSCQVLDALFDALPEPHITGTSVGMRLCRELERHLLAIGIGQLADDDLEGGFHAGDADTVEAWLREREGVRMIRLAEI